jgi:hypothetical protein
MTRLLEKTGLTATDQAVLAHVETFGLTVLEAVLRLRSIRDEGHALEVLLRLERAGHLASTALYGTRQCFYWPRTPQSTANRLSEETKIRKFAALSFCWLGDIRREPASAIDLHSVFPDSSELPSSPGYYVQAAAKPLIGFSRVDMGGPGRWDRVLAKCCEDARRHAENPAFRPAIAAGQFEIALVTSMPQKAERLCRALRQLSTLPAIPIRVTSVPELVNLVAPPPN